MDALLGAAALGDIGQHFPDTDPKYKGISSIALLKEVGALLEAEGYVIENIDATIIAQRPSWRRTARDGRKLPTRCIWIKPGECEGNHRGGAWIHRKW